jgi:hypothetical protein
MSAMTPELLVRGATAKKPHIKRVTSKVVMLFAQASPMWKIVYMARVPTKMGRRPISSEPGPQNVGPNIKPTRKRVVTRLPTSLPTWKSCAIVGIEEDGAEEPNVLIHDVSQCNLITTQVSSVRWDVHVECHYGASYGDKPSVPDRPVFRVFGVFGTIPGNDVRVCVRFG